MQTLEETLAARRDGFQTELDGIIAAAESESRDLSEAEATSFNDLRAQIASTDERIAALADERARRAAAAAARNDLDLPSGGATVTSEERMYFKGSGRSYLLDQCRAAAFNDPDAAARLARHAREFQVESQRAGTYEARVAASKTFGGETRAGLTTVDGAGGTFVPPEYLIDEFVPFLREARPFADATDRQPLPKGTNVVYLPKVTGGAGVAPQATNNTAVTETDITDAYISAPVNTYAGQQTVSLQLIEQSPINFDEIIFKDLLAALAVQIDTDVINGSGSSGHHAGVLGVSGINAVTFTSGSPTASLLYPWIGDALALVRKNRKAQATHCFMTPERWYWLVTSTDTQGRPLVVPADQGSFNALAAMLDVPPVYQSAGSLLGVPVFLDANIPYNLGGGTNQDAIIVGKLDDLYLYEGEITSRALPQTLGNQLSVLLQVYQYSAFLPTRYPVAISAINGTGLTPPVF